MGNINSKQHIRAPPDSTYEGTFYAPYLQSKSVSFFNPDQQKIQYHSHKSKTHTKCSKAILTTAHVRPSDLVSSTQVSSPGNTVSDLDYICDARAVTNLETASAFASNRRQTSNAVHQLEGDERTVNDSSSHSAESHSVQLPIIDYMHNANSSVTQPEDLRSVGSISVLATFSSGRQRIMVQFDSTNPELVKVVDMLFDRDTINVNAQTGVRFDSNDPELRKVVDIFFGFDPATTYFDRRPISIPVKLSLKRTQSVGAVSTISINGHGGGKLSIPAFFFDFRPTSHWEHSPRVYVLTHNLPERVDLQEIASDSRKRNPNEAYVLGSIDVAAFSQTSVATRVTTPRPGPTPTPSPVPPPNPTPASKPPIMTSAFDFVKISPSIFEILRMSMFDDFFSMGPVEPDLAQPIHVFKATFSCVQLALAGFFFDSSLRIRCSGCKEFDMSPIDAFLPWDLYSHRCRREWCNLLNTLCDEPRHGVNCFWTQQLRNARETGSTAGASGTSNDATSSQIDYRSALVLSLQEPAERTEFTRELVDRPVYSEELTNIHQIRNWIQYYRASPESATNSLSRLLSVTHEQLEKVKMLYLMPHNTEPLPSANTQPGQPPQRRPLTMDEAQAICKVVDFKRDPPRDPKQREAETMRFAMKRYVSFMSLELFSRTAAGRKFALYAAQSGFFLSSQTESAPQTTEYRVPSAFRDLRINCSFCLRTTRLKVSLENEPQVVFNYLHTRHDQRSPTCPMSLGAKADDVSFTVVQRSAIMLKIAELDDIPSASISLCLTPPGLFRRVRMNEAAVLSVPNTTHFDAKTEPDCIREAVSLPELIGSCEVATALTEDCEECNVDFIPERRPDQQIEVNSLWDVNSFLYDANDARLTKELHEETIVNPENYDLCTALVGDKKPVSADRANVMARVDTFFKRNLVVGYEAPEALWPHSRQTPESLANAGFYFAPDVWRSTIRDRVICFHCDEEAFAWTESDEPFVKHFQLNPLCPFLLRIRGCEWVGNTWSSQAASSIPYKMFKSSMSIAF